MGARDEKNGRRNRLPKKPAEWVPIGLQLRSNTNATSHIHLRWGRAISGWGYSPANPQASPSRSIADRGVFQPRFAPPDRASGTPVPRGYAARMIRFGSLELKSNLFLSPLAGYTNLPFRRVVREIGGVDLCTTDLVNARSSSSEIARRSN